MSTELISIRVPSPSSSVIENARWFELESTKESKKEVREDVTVNKSENIITTIQISATAPIIFSPIRVEGGRLIINADAMKPDIFYPIEYEGVKQLVKKSKDGKIEFYEIVSENDRESV